MCSSCQSSTISTNHTNYSPISQSSTFKVYAYTSYTFPGHRGGRCPVRTSRPAPRFNNVNGSGKHNNWSIATSDGTNLLNVPQLAKNTGDDGIFPVIMAAMVKAMNENGENDTIPITTFNNTSSR